MCAAVYRFRTQITHVIEEILLVGRNRQHVGVAFHPHVVSEFERGLGNDTERPVATDCTKEDLRLCCRGRLDERPVGQNQLERLYRVDEWTESNGPAMTVHGQRATDREVRVRLHDSDRQVCRVDYLLNLTPGRPALHSDRLAGW
jgi:hypothetical protein